MNRILLYLMLPMVLVVETEASDIETLAVVRELDEVNVPAQRDGLITALIVRRGMPVSAQQRIAELDQTEISLRLDVSRTEFKQAQAKADNDGPIATAKAGASRAQTEMRLLEAIGDSAVYLEKFRTKNNLEKSMAELKSAESQLLQDRIQVDVKSRQTKLLENDLRLTAVESPYDGIVHEILKHQGEWARQGDPIVKIIRMDKLLIEGFLDSKVVSPHAVVGARVKAKIQISGRSPVEFDSLLVEHTAAKLELDGKFPVWVEVQNLITEDNGQVNWLIRPGMRGSMVVTVSD